MKRVAGLVLACGSLLACVNQREIQVERVNVQVVRIDTIYRESGNLKALTWADEHNTHFYSIEPINTNFPIGFSMSMLVRR